MEKNISKWEELVRQEWMNYLRDGAVGNFSHEGHPGAEWFGRKIARFKGKFLDVGCGVLPLPVYMKYPEGEWFGIDPLSGNESREFHFIQGVSENIPFPADFFDLIVFATSLDHVRDVQLTIKESKRVLKIGGHIALWTSLRSEAKYLKWKGSGAQADKHHLHMFSKNTIGKIFGLPIIEWDESFRGSHCIIFKKMNDEK